MRIPIAILLCFISVSSADSIKCQSFNAASKTFAYICSDYTGPSLGDCSQMAFLVKPSEVIRLKFGGCDSESIAYALELCSNVRNLDISHSGYNSLQWNFGHEHIQSINASHNELSEFPWTQSHTFFARFPDLIAIDLSFNHFVCIRSFGINRILKLQQINLSHNNISMIEANAFDNVINLEYIDLGNNRIMQIIGEPFLNSRKLKFLQLQHNPIIQLDCRNLLWKKFATVFLPWQEVRELNAYWESVRYRVKSSSQYDGFLPTPHQHYELHCNERSFPHLITFNTQHNRFENILEIMKCFGATLKRLHLGGNYVGSVPKGTFRKFVHLQTLNLSQTQLSDFDVHVLKGQVHLKMLDISGNGLSHVDGISVLWLFNELVEIRAAGNQLTNALELLRHLPRNVKSLDLSDSHIGRLNADTFIGLETLEKLILRNTGLFMIDFTAFDQLMNLQTLDISDNNLSGTDFTKLSTKCIVMKYPDGIEKSADFIFHQRLKHLHTFKLSNTYLRISDLTPFGRLQSLKVLDISNNHLNRILFTNLQITSLDVSGNDVGEISSNTFDAFKHLAELRLSNTKLSISGGINPFEPLENLTVLHISYNNLRLANFTLFLPTLRKLHEFKAADCRIWGASGLIQHFNSALSTLDLSGNNLNDLNSDEFKRFNLISLHLNNAKIQQFNLSGTSLTSFKIANNQLRKIDFNTAPPQTLMEEIDLKGNELVEIENLNRRRFPWLHSLDISNNRLQCESVAPLAWQWHEQFNGNPWLQKDIKKCWQMNV